MANPLRGPVFVTFKVCHVFPPSRLCHTQLEVVKSPLMTAQPSLLLHKWRHNLDACYASGRRELVRLRPFRAGHPDRVDCGRGRKDPEDSRRRATWTLQRSAVHSFNLIDVSFADLNNGWTVGGEELHTTDGGTTWVNQATGVFGSVSVYAISPTTAWIGGLEDLGRTTDSGATWTIERPSDTDWFCMTFLDADNGWAGGQDQTIDDAPGSIWKRAGRLRQTLKKTQCACARIAAESGAASSAIQTWN